MKFVTITLAAMITLRSEAGVFDFNVSIDLLGNPKSMVVDERNNYVTVNMPIPGFSGEFRGGDTLNITIGLQAGQRLLLTPKPTGQSAPLGSEGIGLFVINSLFDFNIAGSVFSSLSLIDPSGNYLLDAMNGLSLNFAAAQGALTRHVVDWADGPFSVAGFKAQIRLGNLSQPVRPDAVVLELRELRVQEIPEPNTWQLLLTALGIFSLGKLALRRSQ